MHNRNPILPIDIKYDIVHNNADTEPKSNPYDITTFQSILESAALIREATNEKASQNIKHQKDYNIATAQYQQHCLLDLRCSCRIKDDRIGKEGVLIEMDWTLYHKINLRNWTLCSHQ